LALVSQGDKLGPKDLDSQLMKARVLEALGKREEALTVLRAAVKQGTTKFEIEYIPDLQSLRKDPGYFRILQ
jgi:eukaryotic-like serine/threonine-protein kinase